MFFELATKALESFHSCSPLAQAISFAPIMEQWSQLLSQAMAWLKGPQHGTQGWWEQSLEPFALIIFRYVQFP